jgi:hypothetical protein
VLEGHHLARRLSVAAAATGCHLVEAADVVEVAVEDLLALGGVHTLNIGAPVSERTPRMGERPAGCARADPEREPPRVTGSPSRIVDSAG